MSYGYGGGGGGRRGGFGGGRGYGGGKMPPYPVRGVNRYNPMGRRGGYEGSFGGRAPPPPPLGMYDEPPKKKIFKKLKVQACNNEEDKKSIYVVNIPDYATQEQLTLLFGQCGVVKNVSMPKDHNTGLFRGIAFIRFEHEDEAYFSISSMSGKEMRPESGYDEPGFGHMHGRLLLPNKPLVVKIKEGEEKVVHIENLPQNMKPKQVAEYLAKYGTLTENIFMPKDTKTGVSRGVTLARFESSEEANAVVNNLNKKELKQDGGSICILSPALPKTQKLEVSICDDGCTLQVGSIPSGYSTEVLEAMFSPYGSLAEQVDYSELRNRATIKFESEESAASAAEALDGSEIEISGGKDQESTVDTNQRVSLKKIVVKLATNEDSNRTAFITNIPKVYEEEDIRLIFSSYGDILDVNVAKDPKTKQPRGMCFIKFEKIEDTNNFIESMNGKEIEIKMGFDPYHGYYEVPPPRKRKLSVKPSNSNPENFLHISNLPKSITPGELAKMLTPYGMLKQKVTIPMDKITGLPRGFTLVCFENKEMAEAAIEGLNGKEIEEDESKVRHIIEGDYKPQEMDGRFKPRYEEPPYEGEPGFNGYEQEEYYDEYNDPHYLRMHRPPHPDPARMMNPAHRPTHIEPAKQLVVRKCNTEYNKKVGVEETNKTVWVGNVPQYMSNQELENKFAKYGTIVMMIKRPRDKFTGLLKEHTFVRYQNKEEAAAAIEAMNRPNSREEAGDDEWSREPQQEGSFGHEEDSAFWSDDPPQDSGPSPWNSNTSSGGLVSALSSLNKVCGHLGLLGPALRGTIERALDVGTNAITILGVFQDTETQGMLDLVDMKLGTLEKKAMEPQSQEMFVTARKNVAKLKNPKVMMN